MRRTFGRVCFLEYFVHLIGQSDDVVKEHASVLALELAHVLEANRGPRDVQVGESVVKAV